MQTHFTPQQLRDPSLAQANRILRSCVHCGMCTATCPTYQVLGDELDSPRGRIYLIKEMLESGRPADARTARHIDRCLSCLACTTTCPSGVDYMHLIDLARSHVEATWRRPWHDRLLRAVLARVLPSQGLFRLALLAARLARPLGALLPDPRLRAMLALAPRQIPPVSQLDDPQSFAPEGARRMRVVLMPGCAQRVLDTGINTASIRLLRRLGCEVVIPEGFSCCGALSLHMGRGAEGKARAAASLAAFAAARQGGEVDAIVINTSGCGTSVKDYTALFAEGPLAEQARWVAERALDITELIARLGLPQAAPAAPAQAAGHGEPVPGPQGLRVAYHAACSLQHGQKITQAPKTLLQQAGFDVVLPADSHLCCGSAGTYNLLQPEISAELGRRKVETLLARQPQVIAAGNIGCMMQIGARAGVPVVHTVELLDWATGGPVPPKMAAAGRDGAPD